jgi:hypothetical protein
VGPLSTYRSEVIYIPGSVNPLFEESLAKRDAYQGTHLKIAQVILQRIEAGLFYFSDLLSKL